MAFRQNGTAFIEQQANRRIKMPVWDPTPAEIERINTPVPTPEPEPTPETPA